MSAARVLRDRVNFVARLFKRNLEGRAEMRRLDARERRRLERPGPVFEEGVVFFDERLFQHVTDGFRLEPHAPDLANPHDRRRGAAATSRMKSTAAPARPRRRPVDPKRGAVLSLAELYEIPDNSGFE